MAGHMGFVGPFLELICSSKSECITMAAAPASSRRRTRSGIVHTIGEAPGRNGFFEGGRDRWF